MVALPKTGHTHEQPAHAAPFVRESPASKRLPATSLSQPLQRARYYDPSTGEFTSRDPLEYVDGLSLMRAFLMLNTIDPEGKHVFQFCQEVVDTPVPGICGGATASVSWKMNLVRLTSNINGGKIIGSPVGPPLIAPIRGLNGWIIQQISIDEEATDCDDVPIADEQDECFFEAWKVEDGLVYVGDTALPHDGWVDRFSLRDRGINTKGQSEIVGRVAFLEDYELTYPPWGHAGKGNTPMANDEVLPWLKCEDGSPEGWERANPLERRLVSEWECCPCTRMFTDTTKSAEWESRCGEETEFD